MKTLDAKALHNGIDGLLQKLQLQMEHVKKLENSVDDFSSMRNAFKGQGGTAIRGFYDEWHSTILSFYQHMLNEYERVLTNVKKASTDLEPEESGFIRQSFIEAELTNGVNLAKSFTTDLVDDVNSALDNVSDILYVTKPSDDRFHAFVQQATKKMTETVDELGTFDSTQTSELFTVEQDIQTLKKTIDEMKDLFNSGNLTIGTFSSSMLKGQPEFSHFKKELAEKRITALGDALTSPFAYINDKLSKGDIILAGYQSAVSLYTIKAAGKLKINYLRSKPTLWQKIRGNYKFSVGMDPSWTSKSKHSDKWAKRILNFSRAPQPTNPFMKPLHSFVKSYNSPSHLYKHVAGFPKNASLIDGKEFIKGTTERMSAGTKEVVGKSVTKSGLISVGRRVPLMGNVISAVSNLGELTDPANANKSTAEKFGRAGAGFATDMLAIGAGAKIGAAIGSVGGPVGIVIGGAVGGLVGGIASSKFGNKVKDLGGKIGKEIGEFADEKIKEVKDFGKKVKDSIVSWFN